MARALPSDTFSARTPVSPGSPAGNWALRIIDLTNLLQAIEKLLQGGPRCKKGTPTLEEQPNDDRDEQGVQEIELRLVQHI